MYICPRQINVLSLNVSSDISLKWIRGFIYRAKCAHHRILRMTKSSIYFYSSKNTSLSFLIDDLFCHAWREEKIIWACTWDHNCGLWNTVWRCHFSILYCVKWKQKNTPCHRFANSRSGDGSKRQWEVLHYTDIERKSL